MSGRHKCEDCQWAEVGKWKSVVEDGCPHAKWCVGRNKWDGCWCPPGCLHVWPDGRGFAAWLVEREEEAGMKEGIEEGDGCGRNGCDGVMEIEPVKDCSCHIAPPCSACVEARVWCPKCGYVVEKD